MVQRIGPDEVNTVFKFGGGLHTRASPDEINDREAAGGFNFTIDIDNRNLRSRAPFDLIGTAPNNASIRGGASLIKADGTVTSLIQAGGTVYKWNGGNSFTSKGSCSAGCKLRGLWRTHTYNLTDIVLITDLTLTDGVYQWDGTTFSSVTFTDQNGAGFGTFKAKYCDVQEERATFANTFAASATPHLIVSSKRSLYTQITVVNRPSSSLGTGDPWFLLSPDLKPINGFLSTYKGIMISTANGQIFNLTGTDATNFAFSNFYAGSGATGDESPEEIGNDFMYGRPGRLESVRDTQNFGNSTAADLTAVVSDKISGYTSWNNVFNSRTRKLYCFPVGVSEVWVMDTAIRDSGEFSPWCKWTTSHSMAFQPTMVMSMIDPLDSLEYVLMGDASGNLYRMEGTGTGGDGGTATIDTQFLTRLVAGRLDAQDYDIEGYIKYQTQGNASVANLTFQYQGYKIFSKSISTTMSAAQAASYFGDSAYFGNSAYFGSFSGRMQRNRFSVPGINNDFQVLIDVTGTNAFSINEIGIRLKSAS